MKTVDFAKKIVCSDESVKVIQVIPVNYDNDNFKHLVIYENTDGYQNNCAVNKSGEPSNASSAWYSNLTFLNPEPKVVSSTYRNVYNSGFIRNKHYFREAADHNSDTNRCGILETLEFDNGTTKTNYIEV